MPNLLELRSLAAFGANDPPLPAAHPFVDVFTNEYWTSTSTAPNQAAAWTINFSFGQNFYYNKGNPRRVWLVRGTPLASPVSTPGAVLTIADGSLEFADDSLQETA